MRVVVEMILWCGEGARLHTHNNVGEGGLSE